jgi:hypothetical protein
MGYHIIQILFEAKYKVIERNLNALEIHGQSIQLTQHANAKCGHVFD